MPISGTIVNENYFIRVIAVLVDLWHRKRITVFFISALYHFQEILRKWEKDLYTLKYTIWVQSQAIFIADQFEVLVVVLAELHQTHASYQYHENKLKFLV